MPLPCPNSLVAFFPAEVYRNVGARDVLPQLVEVLGRDKLSTVQFLRNGAVRLTFVDTPSCDAVPLTGFRFNDHSIRVQGVWQRSRLVYLRDLSFEVPDDAAPSVRLVRCTLFRSRRTMAFQGSLMALESSRCP